LGAIRKLSAPQLSAGPLGGGLTFYEKIMFDDISDKTLYKYRTTSRISEIIRLISNGELWFSSARSFNDPFDTAITYNFEGADSPIAEKWAVKAVNFHFPNLSQIEKERMVAERLKQIRNDPDFIEASRQEAIEHNYNSFGICSLSKKKDDLLLWAHYANKHSGLCIGLNVDVIKNAALELLRSKHVINLLKVDYSRNMPNINFFTTMLGNDFTHIIDFVRIKGTEWEKEEEIRLVCYEHPEISLELGSNLVSEIIFGCNMQKEEKNLLANYCRLNYPRICLYEAKKVNQLFQLRIDPFKYL
jgi:hypothetical protein